MSEMPPMTPSNLTPHERGTPRTDLMVRLADADALDGVPFSDFARQLERELIAANARERKLVEALEAKLQSIDTAPKDGTEILLYRPARRAFQIGRWDTDKYAKKPRPFWNSYSVWGISGDRAATPSHWMPLPEAPYLATPAPNASTTE